MKETIQENLGVIEGTTAIGADGREALSKRWVAALVQVRNEKAVGKKLTDLKIENYVATQWEIHQWSDRKKKVEQVVIPMIVFIHTDKVVESMLDQWWEALVFSLNFFLKVIASSSDLPAQVFWTFLLQATQHFSHTGIEVHLRLPW